MPTLMLSNVIEMLSYLNAFSTGLLQVDAVTPATIVHKFHLAPPKCVTWSQLM